MGAVMAIKHLAGKAETCDQAMKLFSMYIILHTHIFCLIICLIHIKKIICAKYS